MAHEFCRQPSEMTMTASGNGKSNESYPRLDCMVTKAVETSVLQAWTRQRRPEMNALTFLKPILSAAMVAIGVCGPVGAEPFTMKEIAGVPFYSSYDDAETILIAAGYKVADRQVHKISFFIDPIARKTENRDSEIGVAFVRSDSRVEVFYSTISDNKTIYKIRYSQGFPDWNVSAAEMRQSLIDRAGTPNCTYAVPSPIKPSAEAWWVVDSTGELYVPKQKCNRFSLKEWPAHSEFFRKAGKDGEYGGRFLESLHATMTVGGGGSEPMSDRVFLLWHNAKMEFDFANQIAKEARGNYVRPEMKSADF